MFGEFLKVIYDFSKLQFEFIIAVDLKFYVFFLKLLEKEWYFLLNWKSYIQKAKKKSSNICDDEYNSISFRFVFNLNYFKFTWMELKNLVFLK